MGTLKPLHLFDTSMPGVFRGVMPPLWTDAEAAPPAIRIDVAETDEHYTVKADMPGFRKEDIRVDVDANLVSITAEVSREAKDEKEGKVLRSERHVGAMTRAFTLPLEVDVDKTQATYADGVLTLTLPKHRGTPSHRVVVN